MSELNYINSKKNIILYLVLILTFGLGLRLYYFPYEVPIVTDGFYFFVYAVKTISVNGLPIDYSTANTGWANFLSVIFMFFDKTNPLHLMDVQRSVSVIISTVTVIPAFFIFKRFVNNNLALFGSLLFVIEPRLLLISLEGINYSLFIFLFILSIAFFLKKTNFSLFFSFVCIALCTLIRYEGLLLVIPVSIMYFVKFRDRRSTLRFLGMIFVFTMILLSVGILRMQVTENICVEYIYGTVCGEDGFSNQFLSGFEYFYRYIITGEQIGEYSDLSHDFHREVYDKPGQMMISEAAIESFSRIGKFLGLSLIPYFGFFIAFNLITRIQNKKHFNFDSKVIIFCTSVMLLPSLYAYMRGIDEIRYVLILIPLFCLLSISFKESINHRILKDKRIFIILILLPVIFSISFIEYQKRDYNSDMESFKVSQEIVSITNVTNVYHQGGYIKVANLFNEWPELPEASLFYKIGITGLLETDFKKISTKSFEKLEDFIEKNRHDGLEYLVVDEETRLFSDLRQEPQEYPYLDKVFDSDDYDFINHYRIYKINYTVFDKND